MDYQNYVNLTKDFILNNGINVVVAFLILIIGFWVSKRLVKAIKVLMEKREIEITLRNFLGDVIS